MGQSSVQAHVFADLLLLCCCFVFCQWWSRSFTWVFIYTFYWL